MPLAWDTFWTIIAQVMVVITLIGLVAYVGSIVYVNIYERIFDE